MNRFCFIDSSGIIKSDPFFGTGLLIVKNIGDIADKLNQISQPAKEKARQNKNTQIAHLLGKR